MGLKQNYENIWTQKIGNKKRMEETAKYELPNSQLYSSPNIIRETKSRWTCNMHGEL